MMDLSLGTHCISKMDGGTEEQMLVKSQWVFLTNQTETVTSDEQFNIRHYHLYDYPSSGNTLKIHCIYSRHGSKL